MTALYSLCLASTLLIYSDSPSMNAYGKSKSATQTKRAAYESTPEYPQAKPVETFSAYDGDGKEFTVTGNAIVYMPAGASRTDISMNEGRNYTIAINNAIEQINSTRAPKDHIKIYFCCYENSFFIRNGIRAALGNKVQLIYAKTDKQKSMDGVIIIKNGAVSGHAIGSRQDVITKNVATLIKQL